MERTESPAEWSPVEPHASEVLDAASLETLGRSPEQTLSPNPEALVAYTTWIEATDAMLDVATKEGVVTPEFREEYEDFKDRVADARGIDDLYSLASTIGSLRVQVFAFVEKLGVQHEALTVHDAIAVPIVGSAEQAETANETPSNPETRQLDQRVGETLGSHSVANYVQLSQAEIASAPPLTA